MGCTVYSNITSISAGNLLKDVKVKYLDKSFVHSCMCYPLAKSLYY